MRHKAVKIFIFGISLIVLIIVLFVTALQQKHVRENEKFFNELDRDYSLLDQDLTNTLGKKVDYDQNTQCYYWKKPEFSILHDNGPLGCFRSRTYYFQAQNMRMALNLETKIASVVNSTFANVQDLGSSINPPVVSVSGNSFYTTNMIAKKPSIPGACFFTLSFPPRKLPVMDLPTRQSNQMLMLVTSCGGDAVKSYYQFINQQ